MHKHHFLIAVALIGILISGCKDENVTPDDVSSYRLKAWYDENYRYDIEYDGEKVSEVLYSIDSEIKSKDKWIYEGNTITIRQYVKMDTGWRTSSFYKHLTYNTDNKLSEAYYFMPNGYTAEYEYFWEGDRVTSQKTSGIGNTEFRYTYENDLLTLISYTTDSQGTNGGHERLSYESGKVKQMDFWIDSDTIRRAKFIYDGNHLSEIINSDPSGEFPNVYKEQYTFDANDNLSVKVRLKEGATGSSTTFIEYETGKGNFDQYWLVRYGWLAVYLYPNMMPADKAHGCWSNYDGQTTLQY
jgi:hypothetical protein